MTTIIQSKVSLKSTYLYSVSPTTNFHNDGLFQNLVRSTAGLPSIARGMFRVKLSEDMSGIDFTSIISVKLHWYVHIASGTGAITVDTFNENPNASGTIDITTCTWQQRSTGVPWVTAGGDLMFPVLVPNFPMNSIGWYNIDITAWAIESLTSNEKFLYLTVPTYQNRVAFFRDEFWTTPSEQPYLEIEYEPLVCSNNLSDLGRFRLGCAQLGTQLATKDVYEVVRCTDNDQITAQITTILTDALETLDASNMHFTGFLEDMLELLDSGFFPIDGWAAVVGKIVLRLDVDAVDFCAAVEESGMSIEINDVPSRAFTFIKQRGQKFDIGINIFPGDAVMFSCPDDDIYIKRGDIIKFDGQTFQIVHIINKYFDGNIIYRKSALQKVRSIPTLPTVGDIVIGDNNAGKVTLSWGNMNTNIYPWFDHFEIWEGYGQQSFQLYAIAQSIKTFQIIGNATTWLEAGDTIIIEGSTGNDGEYTIDTSTYDGINNLTFVKIIEDIPSSVVDGTIWRINLDTGLVKSHIETITQPEYFEALLKLAINECPSIWQDSKGGKNIKVVIEDNEVNYGDYVTDDQLKELPNQIIKLLANFSNKFETISGNIVSITDAWGGYVTITTDTPHGLITGDDVKITETTDYNGDYQITNETEFTFNIPATWVATEIGIWSYQKSITEFGNMLNLKNFTQIKETKNNSVILSNISENQDTFFMIRAVDIYGKKGKFSIEVQSYTPARAETVEGLR